MHSTATRRETFCCTNHTAGGQLSELSRAVLNPMECKIYSYPIKGPDQNFCNHFVSFFLIKTVVNYTLEPVGVYRLSI